MKKTKIITLAAALTLGVAAQAQQPTPTLSYTGTSLPTTQGWTELRLDSSVNPFAAPVTVEATNGALKFTSANGVDTFSQVGWYKLNPGMDAIKGYTIELKAKLSLAQKGSFNIQGYDNSGKGFRLSFVGDSITNQSDPLTATQTVANGLTSDGQFHVYRLAAMPLSGLVHVYRDGVKVGQFPLAAFQLDNIVENGGFEDEGFPDFLSNGTLTRIDSTGQASKVYAGKYALEANNDGKVTKTGADYTDGTDMEAFRTRELAIKPGAKYESFITRRRLSEEPWAWRDLGIFYNDQEGTLQGEDKREPRVTFGALNDLPWQTHPQNFTAEAGKQSVRFEFPSWVRDNNKYNIVSLLDNIILRERHDFSPFPDSRANSVVTGVVFPEGYVNLIANGDFEDTTKNNDGSDYAWALASGDQKGAGDNFPVKLNELWGAHVRLQDVKKGDDTGDEWAHSGKNSLRISYLADEGQGKTFENTAETPQAWRQNINFKWPLEANKSYIFSFWIKAADYNDNGTVKIGKGSDELLWSKALNQSEANIKWTNYSIAFSTAEALDTLKIFTEFANWFNFYLDDIALYEVADATIADPQLVGKTNLIANGGFEDTTKNSDGSDYEWALASHRLGETYTDNYPVKLNELWGAHVRLQDVKKGDDTGDEWAHSGSKSLRVSYLAEAGPARTYEGIPEDSTPQAWKQNINFEKALEANKTYTFVFWIKTANYPDNGRVKIANGSIEIWNKELTQADINWTRFSITFSTTEINHTLRIFTEFTGWFNFYLDDLFLYEEDAYVPYENSYLFFGKSQNTASADVEVEYVRLYADGAYSPDGQPVPAGAYVTYHPNDGVGVPSDSLYLTEAGAVPLPSPTREHYSFAGWYSNADLTGSAVTEIPQNSLASLELWAMWNAVPYSITCHANGVVGITDTVIAYTIEDVVALPTLDGYTVTWYEDENLTGEGIATVPAGTFGNKEFWASSEPIRYTISYHPNQGDPVPDSAYTIESAALTLPEAVRSGYTFAGWYANSGLTGDAVTQIPTGSTGNKEFWAKWTKEEESTAVSAVAASALRIYPNPVSGGLLTIDNLPAGSEKVEVYSVSGALAGVYSVTGVQATIDISSLPAGAYIVKAAGKTAKVVKE
ncbi:MAG: InlB B-repeat-containing protein [Prevotellaceae bacterium]|jgi:uncharacterized repeat protein (TIGR02543 family)|nr:InlB B-repeat-containing protein [Prevotellaceae bacterium]